MHHGKEENVTLSTPTSDSDFYAETIPAGENSPELPRPSASHNRLSTLDALRGIAALSVVIGHSLYALPSLAWMVFMPEQVLTHDLKFYIASSPIRFLWNATPAVILFFVLSGFVLSISYFEATAAKNYLAFAVKRIVRLWLPSIAIIVVSVCLRNLVFEPGMLIHFNSWVNTMWINDVSVSNFIEVFLLRSNFNQIDPALWTLPVEIKLSLLLPIVVPLLSKLNKIGTVVVLILWLIGYHSLVAIGVTRVWPSFNIVFYFSFFLFGMVLCKYRLGLVNRINSTSPVLIFVLFLGALFIYTGNYSLWWLPGKLYGLFMKIPEAYRVSLPCMVFILLALSRFGITLLRTKILQLLGRISFSLYLIHQVVIVATVYLLSSILGPYLTIAVAFVLTLGLSGVFYYLCERPSAKLAQFLSRYIRTRKTDLLLKTELKNS